MGRYINYTRYLLRHKWYVLLECWKRGLYIQGIMHDMSKFRPSEFFPYARHFYNPDGTPKPDEDDPAFNIAWLLHQHRNPHHWQYWVLYLDSGKGIIIEMPNEYRWEMICDWIGAGKALGYYSPPEDPYKEVREWYIKNQKNMFLHTSTRSWIEYWLDYWDGVNTFRK